jgi:hypothetical protein
MGNTGRVIKNGLAVLGFLLRYNLGSGTMVYVSCVDGVRIFLEITDGGVGLGLGMGGG